MTTDIYLFAGPPGQNQKLTPIDVVSLVVQMPVGVEQDFKIRAELSDEMQQLIERLSDKYPSDSKPQQRMVAIRITEYDTTNVLFDGDVLFSPADSTFVLTVDCGRPPKIC